MRPINPVASTPPTTTTGDADRRLDLIEESWGSFEDGTVPVAPLTTLDARYLLEDGSNLSGSDAESDMDARYVTWPSSLPGTAA